MALALVMDDHESADGLSSKDLVDRVMYGEGQMAYIMSNGLFRDGGGFESPSYNTISSISSAPPASSSSSAV